MYYLSMHKIPKDIYLANQVRELDRIAIEEYKIPSFGLMQYAGESVFKVIQQLWPSTQKVVVLAGTGNNGGDGYVIAGLARAANLHALVLQVGDHSTLGGDAKLSHDAYVNNGGECSVFTGELLPKCDVIVDALLGTGLTRPVTGEYASAIDCINGSQVPVVSADIPSGLDANTGQPLGSAVIAAATATFVGMKLGLLTGLGRRYSGKLYFNDLQVPSKVYQSVTAACHSIDLDEFHALLGERNADAHKGDFGHVLIIGGNQGMAGSVMLAAEAAARSGSGLVSVATIPAHANMAVHTCREIMVHGVEDISGLKPLLERATVVAIGPGLGQDQWAKNIFSHILELDLPLVIDADALNLLAQDPMRKTSWILTPHPGEAARLLHTTTRDAQHQRLASVQTLQQQYQGVCVLKGSGTLVACENEVSLCTAGNPGMASAGMGDVLTGIISALLAQGFASYNAARFGVQLHAQSADIVAQDGMRGMLASELFTPLRRLVNTSCS